MKRDPAPTLSRHLLNVANKFLIYPDPLPRGVRPDDDRFGIDEMFSTKVEGRRTFVSIHGQLPRDPEIQQRVLDTTYCRELLKRVPDMVQRTLALRELSYPESANSEWWVYLQESAHCLVFGLSQAAVALARAAVEACLREAYAKVPGNAAHALQDTTLDPLISPLSNLFNLSKGRAGLSPEAERWAREVQRAGNDVLHGRLIDAKEALKVLEAARLVIQSVAGG